MTAWRAAAGGVGQVVVLTGEAGIGKTSLLAEVNRRVGVAGGRTAIGTGLDVGGQTPFAVWLEVARALVATAAPVPVGATWPAELSRLSPDLGARLASRTACGRDGTRDRAAAGLRVGAAAGRVVLRRPSRPDRAGRRS